ncbi:hypothetical protein QR98_0073690 [Sarcoptes scabiei]|uniref:Uncharacterized protein n=1 Tax=Sarcoptes scabiei TaxID=52283 RepID=A0A132ACY3_SARSC|nr:hypothetical protein QR98_0073690 [Sarcoptes scabiei]
MICFTITFVFESIPLPLHRFGIDLGYVSGFPRISSQLLNNCDVKYDFETKAESEIELIHLDPNRFFFIYRLRT